MSDIKVALSSTGHLLQIDGPTEILELLKKHDYPICVADMGLGLFGWGNSQEREELCFAEICKEMAKTVFVDPEKRYVFIGGDPEIPETGLIEYTNNDTINYCSDSFFKQWNLLKSLFMEFNVIGPKEPIFTIRGLWTVNEWKFLEIQPHSNITIVSKGSL
jgi:hypothetical protein